jgi:FtsZ-binding cell division protein ZapB
MLEHRVPNDIPTELAGTIECVVADQLRPAIESLEAASRVTAEELREQHREQQELLRRLKGRMRDEIG